MLAELLLPVALLATGCPTVQEEAVGTITASALKEVSGLSASQRTAGIYWVHNDSGDTARFFAINAAGALRGTYNVTGITATDWEDIACGPGPDVAKTYVYLADTGDNNRDRTDLRIVRVEEPAASLTGGTTTASVSGAVSFPFAYPAGAHYDAETLLVDPVNRKLVLVTRDRGGEGFARVFEAALPGAASQTLVFSQTATLTSPSETLFKGGDFSAKGQQLALLAHSSNSSATHVLVWRRSAGESAGQMLSRAACDYTLIDYAQAEALGIGLDERSIMVTGEGSDQPVDVLTLPPAADENWRVY